VLFQRKQFKRGKTIFSNHLYHHFDSGKTYGYNQKSCIKKESWIKKTL